MLRIDRSDLHARRGQQAFDLAHRGEQPLALLRAQRGQQRPRQVVGPLVQRGTLGTPGRRQAGDSDPPVAPARRDLDQPVGLE